MPDPRIVVLAGPNGAGKSSIGGAAIRSQGGSSFDPDAAARAVRAFDPALSVHEANSLAWYEGLRLLDRAIAERLDFVLETTLGGSTIPRRLQAAIEAGIHVVVWFVALDSVELHLERVRARVARGGHDIPEADVRRRYDQGRLNLVRLLPGLAELHVFDNSHPADPQAGLAPQPVLVLEMVRGRITGPPDLAGTPEWAKPIVAAALRLS